MACVYMPARKVQMVKGPARVTVDGTCHVLGCEVSGQTVTVLAGKALPFEPSRQCRLRIALLGRGGRTWPAHPASAGTSIWQDISQKLFAGRRQQTRTIMLAGGSDTGKSTLSTYLANVALAHGARPCIIDGDIGQGDLAPPAAIGAAALFRQVTDLREVSSSMFEFVGSISPAGVERLVAKKLGSMLDRSRILGDFFIVNTDGYVAGAGGIQYKLMVARELRPDAIVCLGKSPDLLDALRTGPWDVLPAKSSSQAYKSRVERRGRRLDQFVRYIGSSRSHSASLAQITFVYLDRIYSPAAEMLRLPPVRQLEPGNMKRMFVGLGSSNGVAGFGIVTGVSSDSIEIQTDVEAFDRIYLSDIRLLSSDRAAEVRI
jgi:polynucleotide 5'-hydroxyl-kinase GRC3/NOL9